MSEKPDFYALLGIFRDATQEEIKRAYFEAAQRLHPDKNQAPGETEIFLDVQQAYEVLSVPKRRAEYDASLPAENEATSPIVHRALYSRQSLVHLDETQLVYALLEWKPRLNEDQVVSPPLNVCLVLDHSTSMKGDNMDMVKAAAIHLLRGLRQQDVLGIVTFSDRAEVLIPASIRLDKRKMETKIRMILPSGGTEIFQGLEAGVKEVRRHIDPERVNHVILLTDGHTYGDEQACLDLAAEAAEQGIGISGLGIGSDWNDVFLDELAARTGGSSKYISEPRDIQRLLEEEFEQLTKVFAKKATLEFKCGPGVELQYAFRLQPDSGPLSLESPMPLGSILQDVPLSALLEFSIQPSAAQNGAVRLLEGALQVSIPSQPLPVPPLRVRLSRLVTETASPEPPPRAIIRALSNLNLYRMQEKAQADAEAGKYKDASRRLQHLATHLLSHGEQALARTVLLEAENLQRMQSFSGDGRKSIKYGTRALLLPAGKGHTS
ncbi:MAG: VWA domain-containing protein [Chloroflexi bacterium]|nr:VWA domain-containing protein [Chloroflexota bacterium]